MNKLSFRDVDLSKVKLSLKIDLIDNNAVNIAIIIIKGEILKKENFGIFRDYDKDFSVWSSSSFLFDYRQLRLPDIKHVGTQLKTHAVFKDDEQRKVTLEKLYTSLHKWSNKISDYGDEGKVILDEEYWYVL